MSLWLAICRPPRTLFLDFVFGERIFVYTSNNPLIRIMFRLLSHRTNEWKRKKNAFDFPSFYRIWISIKLFFFHQKMFRFKRLAHSPWSLFFRLHLLLLQLSFFFPTSNRFSAPWIVERLPLDGVFPFSFILRLQQSQNEASSTLSSSTFCWVINKLISLRSTIDSNGRSLMVGFHRSQHWRLPLRNFFYCDCTLCHPISSRSKPVSFFSRWSPTMTAAAAVVALSITD